MVLGVDDFTQEFAYLDNRDQWLAREAIGYGTITGLHVDAHLKGGNHEISVSPGVAISPRGQLIRVGSAQCAEIEAWLQMERTQTQLRERGIVTGTAFNAYVVLCYRDCPVDNLPVPGEPCRCDSETMAPSRIQDDFRLELTLQPPPQKEEDAVRVLVEWLRSIPVHDFTPGPGELEAFLGALRAESLQGLQSPPTSGSGSPPGSPPVTLRIPRGQICEWMRAALRVWVTELRPIWQEQWAARSDSSGCGCGSDCTCHGTGAELPEQGRECLLLAQVRITRAAEGVTGVALLEDNRPFLVHLRMLQEVILCGRGRGLSLARTFGTAFMLDAHTIRLWLHYPGTVSAPEAAVTLWLNGVEQADFSVSLVQPNVYDLGLPGSPPDLLASGVTIEIRLDAQLLLDSSGHDLATVFATAWYRFNDYEEPTLRVYGHAAAIPEIPVPNDAAIVAENAFAPAPTNPKPGASPNFARADHTHGLPADPIPPHVANTGAHSNHLVLGDVTGTLATALIGKLQGKTLEAPNPTNNQVLQFVQTTADPQGKWMPRPLTAQAVPVGNDADTAIAAENFFGTNAATLPQAGNSPNFARANHTHGVPPNPIPPHLNDVTGHLDHQIDGDVTGTLRTTFISKLQGVRVDAPTPQPEQVLQFDKAKKAWLAKTITGGGADAVLHPTGLDPYMIVAAGILNIPDKKVSPSYNSLKFKVDGDGFVLSFGPSGGTSPDVRYMVPTDAFTYIVKGHSKGKDIAHSGFLHVVGFLDAGIRVQFIPGLISDGPITEAMIEISLFGKF
jgi:hypothetical protein